MRNLFWLCMAFLFACSEGGGSAIDVTETAETIFTDVCGCNSDADCIGKVEVSVCEKAVCKACSCTVEYLPANTACDDGKANTVDDKCDGKGKCIGRPVSCGDQKCDAPDENCGNCIDDCPCKKDQEICYEDACIPAPVDGNGKCEPTENCEMNPKDCKCPVGKGCYEKQCVACTDYCTGTGRECGEAGGCDCGQCPAGKMCDALGHCYTSAICNNGICEEGENCGNCISDCGCGPGKVCVNDKCEDCGPICAKAGKECGQYGACDCGACPVCHQCKANVCQPKCDCLCWPDTGPNAKECGEIEGCLCGPLKGQCPPGKECVGFKCLEGCDTLCAGKECGWAEDCICDFCNGCDACHNNKCEKGALADAHEPNDSLEQAIDLGSVKDDPTTSKIELSGTIDNEDDIDWYRVEVEDTSSYWGNPTPTVTMTGLAEDKDLDIVLCFKCKAGELVGAGFTPTDSVVEIESPIPMARCFATLNLWGQDETISLAPTCKNNGDESGTVYIVVLPYEPYDCGSGYHLSIHM